jgi:maleate cis-trans isomerase
MYGWRGRIGLLVPAVNSVVEPETMQMAPEGVAVYSARVPLQDSAELAGVGDLVRNATSAARDLIAARVDVIGFACTTASFYEGPEAERRLQETIEQAAGVPVVTAMGAVVEALGALGAGRIALATPYSDRVNALAEGFLRAKGYDVVASSGMAIQDTAKIAFLPEQDTYRSARSVVCSDADVLFLSCTNLPTLRLIRTLELDTGLPVVTSNQAQTWACLQRLGVTGADATFGRLMQIAAPQQVQARSSVPVGA